MDINKTSESYQLGHTNRKGKNVLKHILYYTILYYIIIWTSTDNSLFSENLHGKIFIWQSLRMNIIILLQTNDVLIKIKYNWVLDILLQFKSLKKLPTKTKLT